MIGICVNVNIWTSFSDSSRDGAVPWQAILWQNLGICIHSAEWRMKTARNIAIPIKKI